MLVLIRFNKIFVSIKYSMYDNFTKTLDRVHLLARGLLDRASAH